MRILLTGGTGMVGRNILEHARAADHQVDAPGRDVVDLLDGRAVRDYVRRTRPDVVVHAAGHVGGIQANIAAPVRFFSDNMAMGMNVIHGALEAGVPRLLNIGSSCMYPRNAPNPLREEAILTGELEPTNEGYALAKIAASRLCDYASQERPELAYRTVIPCNLYGRYDKFGANAHMVPAAIAKVHAAVVDGSGPVSIWGAGEARREFMYAADLADFVFAALDRFGELPSLLNVGPGADRTVNAYYEAVAEVLGYDGPFTHDLNKPEGMQRKVVDTARLDAFGWTPNVDLHAGIRRTYEYYLTLEPSR